MAKLSEISDPATIESLRIPDGKGSESFTCNKYPKLQLFVAWRNKVTKSNVLINEHNITHYYRIEWRFRYSKPNGGRTSTTLGSWPEMRLHDAVTRKIQYEELLKSGVDPVEKNKQKRAQEILARKLAGIELNAKYTVDIVLAAMIEDWPRTGKSEDTLAKYKQSIKRYIIPKFIGREMSGISGTEWDAFILEIANIKGKKGAANNVHKAGRKLFSFAVERGFLQYNPLLSRMESVRATKLEPNERWLSGAELHRLLNELDNQELSETAKYATKLMLRLGVRVHEWNKLQIKHINFQQCRIEHPKEIMKARNKVWTYLNPKAIDLIIQYLEYYKGIYGALDPEWYFFPGSDPTKRNNEDSWLAKELQPLYKWIDFTPKHLRKTIATHLSRQGADDKIIDVILNHVLARGANKAYTFDELYHFKRQWLEKWSGLLDDVAKDATALDVESDDQIDEESNARLQGLFG